MFQFTREFILNDNSSAPVLKNGKKFDIIHDDVRDCDALVVARMTNIAAKDVVSVHKHAYARSQNEKLVLDLSNVKASAEGDVARLVITIEQEGRVTALVNDQYPWHSKEYFYEGLAPASKAMPVDEWLKAADHEEHLEEPDRLIHLSEDSGNFVIEAADCYTRIKEVRIVSLPMDKKDRIGAFLTGYEAYNVLLDLKKADFVADPLDAAIVSFLAGTEGAGTPARILKNMRLLTDANLDPYGLNRDERPLPNGQYTQYTIEAVSERRHIGHQVFGSIDHSLTTYVFFVEAGAVAAFDAALKALGVTVCEDTEEAGIAHKVMAYEKDVEAAVGELEIPTKATLPAESVDGTNPTADVELALS